MPKNFIKEIKSAADFEKKVIKENSKLVLVDFIAPWCNPCQALKPILNEVAQKFTNQLFVYQVNISTLKDLANKYQILSIPNLLFFKNGKIKANILGVSSEREIIKKIKDLI